MMVRRRLSCCTRDREISLDFDEQERVMTYNGLETCILNNQSYENESRTSREDGFHTDSLDEDDSSCSSSKDAFGSFSSKWLGLKRDNHHQEKDDWELMGSPRQFYVKEKPAYSIKSSDVDTMKEKFAKLLLGDDISGGKDGLTTARALSNAISNLAGKTPHGTFGVAGLFVIGIMLLNPAYIGLTKLADLNSKNFLIDSVFGELWKLEPLVEERRSKWQREMDWLLSPTNYMVELVPGKQSGANGCTVEIMTPKARGDIHMYLPSLQKLDSMLIEALESMVNNEFWYTEGGSRAEGRSSGERPSKRWWLPSPQVPHSGLSDNGRKKLMHQGRVIHQVMKAARSINESVLLEMPVPTIIRDALPKSGRANLRDELYKVLTTEPSSPEEMLKSLNFKSEHDALDCMNRLEAAVFAWKEKITGQVSGKSPIRNLWSFVKLEKTESLLDRAETLIQHLKHKYPSLPQTFLDATKIQYGKDVGHAILEAYSRVLSNVAFNILSRIQDILQEDVLSNPNSPVVSCCFTGTKCNDFLESPAINHRVRHSLIDQMNTADRRSQAA